MNLCSQMEFFTAFVEIINLLFFYYSLLFSFLLYPNLFLNIFCSCIFESNSLSFHTKTYFFEFFSVFQCNFSVVLFIKQEMNPIIIFYSYCLFFIIIFFIYSFRFSLRKLISRIILSFKTYKTCILNCLLFLSFIFSINFHFHST